MTLQNKSLKTNAMLNVIKQLCSILFPMITFPYASRVLGTTNYGKVNFSYSIITYITLIAGLGISNYAIREGSRIRNDKKKLQTLSNEIYTINIVSTIIAYLILGLLIMYWNKSHGYEVLLIIQSTSILFITLGTDWINSIFEDYFFITIRYVICQSIALVLMLVFVRTSSDYVVYTATSISSTVVANILNFKYIRKKYGIHPCLTLKFDYKSHLKPILLLFGTAVASLIYVNSDITILGIMKDEYTVGLYSVSAKIYSLVKQVMNAVLIVAIPRISSEISVAKKDDVDKHLNEILSNLLVIIGPASAGLCMLASNIVLLVSGKEYYQAYSSLMILSVALLFANIACFFINVILIPYKKEKVVLRAMIISAIVNIGLNIILIPIWSENAAAFTTLVSEMIMLIMGIYYSRDVFQFKKHKSSLIGAVNLGVTLLTCIAVKKYVSSNLLVILISVIFSVVECVSIIYIFDRNKITSILKIVKKKKA